MNFFSWKPVPIAKEIHSADGESYIARCSKGGWGVWFDGEYQDSWRTRELARIHIRWLKLWKISMTPTRFARDPVV